MEVLCPACGSKNITSGKKKGIIVIPYGEEAVFLETIYTCFDCDTSGDFIGENAHIVKKAVRTCEINSVKNMINWMYEIGISNSYFERALRLTFGTVNRWKSGDITPSDLSLLRIVRTYPWILEISDKNFENAESVYMAKS
jgi:DNA-binding transcriptional regulator YiaG